MARLGIRHWAAAPAPYERPRDWETSLLVAADRQLAINMPALIPTYTATTDNSIFPTPRMNLDVQGLSGCGGESGAD